MQTGARLFFMEANMIRYLRSVPRRLRYSVWALAMRLLTPTMVPRLGPALRQIWGKPPE